MLRMFRDKKIWSGIILIAICLTGCAKAPVPAETENIKSVDLGDFPETVQDVITTASGEQKIDAVVIYAGDGGVTEGTLCDRFFTEEEIVSGLSDCGYQVEKSNISLSEEGRLMNYFGSNYSKRESIESKADQQFSLNYSDQVQAVLDALKIHQKIQTYESGTDGDRNIFQFETSAVYENVPMEYNDNSFSFSGYGEMIDSNLESLTIISDFVPKNVREANIMPFSNIFSKFEELIKNGNIKPVSSGQAVDKIQMCYMVEKTEEEYEYYPVWNFEVPYTEEWLKGSNMAEATHYVVLDARTGDIVDYNNGGA